MTRSASENADEARDLLDVVCFVSVRMPSTATFKRSAADCGPVRGGRFPKTRVTAQLDPAAPATDVRNDAK